MLKNAYAEPLLPILSLPERSTDTSWVWVSRFTGKQQTQLSRPHAHSFFEILFVEDGEGWYCMGNHKVWAKSGDLFMIPPGEIHDPSGLDHASKWIIAFAADALAPGRADADVFSMLPNELLLRSLLYTEDVETKHLHVVTEERTRWLLQLQQLDRELCDQALGFTEAARALLMLLLIDAARLTTPQLPKCSVQYRTLLTNLFRFIETNYCNPIGLQEVAKAVNLSPAYLTDLVRRETGRTVLKWIVDRRMAKARCLLLETDQSVNQIAQTLGYFDPGHFIRLFRRTNGTTPQAWRLQHRC